MYDVAVIGAGPAGSALATYLSDRAWSVALIERRSLPQHKVCGEFLSPEVQGTLRRLGLYEPICRAMPQQLQRAALISSRGTELLLDLPAAAWGLSRYTMDALLADEAQRRGAVLLGNSEVLAIRPAEAGWAVELRSAGERSEIMARTVVLACGRHPRASLRPRKVAAGRTSYVGLSCHYTELSMPAQVSLLLFPGGYVGLNPVEGGMVNMAMLVTRERFRQAGGTIERMLEAARQANPGFDRLVRNASICSGSMLAVAPVETNAPSVAWDEVARIGDAVTMIPPLCGDGMAMAMRSAELCAPLAHHYLAGGITLASWQARYQAAWSQEFRGRLRAGRMLERLLMANPLGDMLLAAGRMLPGAAAAIVRATRGAVVPA
jgi:menaquinone-9 beta-reductase